MDRAAKKAKKRLKREQKRRQIQKIHSVSPFRVIETASRVLECRINADWDERGQIQILVLREARGLNLCLASFLIDTWCAGVKDAYSAFNVPRERYEELVASSEDGFDCDFVPIEEAEAARLLATGIRFAQENGFRVFEDVLKCRSFLPGASPETADTRRFGFFQDGKRMLHWVGPMRDLQERLVNRNVGEFLSREDVRFTSLDDAGDDLAFAFDDVVDEEGEGDEDELDLESLAAMTPQLKAMSRVLLEGMIALVEPVMLKLAPDDPLTPDEVAGAAVIVLRAMLALVAKHDQPADLLLNYDELVETLIQRAATEVAADVEEQQRPAILRATELVCRNMSVDAAREIIGKLMLERDDVPPIIDSDGTAAAPA
jgi:hypothetical protein